MRFQVVGTNRFRFPGKRAVKKVEEEEEEEEVEPATEQRIK